MPTVLTSPPVKTEPPRKRWTRVEYENLSAEAVDHERLELVDGELISKMGKKRPHVNSLALLHAWLAQVFGVRFVNQEAPIDVAPEDNPSNEPEPDIIVMNRDLSHFQSSNPGPADLALVVEIASTTLGFDLNTKARLYARAGIAEYWVLDVTGRRMIVHRDPQKGQYGNVAAYDENEYIAPLAAPKAELRVRDVFVA